MNAPVVAWKVGYEPWYSHLASGLRRQNVVDFLRVQSGRHRALFHWGHSRSRTSDERRLQYRLGGMGASVERVIGNLLVPTRRFLSVQAGLGFRGGHRRDDTRWPFGVRLLLHRRSASGRNE